MYIFLYHSMKNMRLEILYKIKKKNTIKKFHTICFISGAYE